MSQEKQGLEWQNDLYVLLLKGVQENKIIVDENTHKHITPEQLEKISKCVYPKYGHRKSHQEKIRFFLQYQFKAIISDLPDLHTDATINAPSLKDWLNYKKEVGVALVSLFSKQKDLKKYLENRDWNVPFDMKMKILFKIYNKHKATDIEPWMKKKLNNALWFKREEIYNEVKRILSCSNRNEEFFHGFTENEINESKDHKDKLDCFINKWKIESALAPEILLESNHVNKSGTTLSKTKENVKPLTKNCKSDDFHSLFEFFRQKGTNEIQFLKKLIIFYISSPAKTKTLVDKLIDGTSSISKKQKTLIYEFMYDDYMQENHYQLFDLILSERCLMMRKLTEIYNLFNLHNINYEKEIEGLAYFEYMEPKFYEVLEKISKR